MAIYFSKAFEMVNHTKLISALILSPLSNNTNRWISAYLTGRTASFRYNFTLSFFFDASVGVPHDFCVSPTQFNFFVSTYRQFANLFAKSYADTSRILVPTPNIA